MDTPESKAADAAENSHDVLQSHPSGWLCIEVAAETLQHNLALFRERVRAPAKLMAVVKADGYGHGLCVAARAFLAGGADMLGVHSVAEALALRNEGLDAPVLVLGPATSREAAEASRRQVDLTVASPSAAAAAAAAASHSAPCRVHLKVETGVYRQGICEEELDTVLSILTGVDCVRLVGLSSHYADIEDTTDHSFARQQMERFTAFVAALAARGHDDLCRHMSCSAAAILWQNSHFDMVRVGISAYGIWPSRETFISARDAGHGDLPLRPALTWKCRVAQIKEVPAGCTVGYGRTWKAPTDSRIAVLPGGVFRRVSAGSVRPGPRADPWTPRSGDGQDLHEPDPGGCDSHHGRYRW